MMKRMFKIAIVALMMLTVMPVSAQSQVVHLQPGESLEADCPVPLKVTVQGGSLIAECPGDVTPTPTPEPTETPPASEHDVTKWHPPIPGDHHHGADVMDTRFAKIWLRWTEGQEISYPWTSSPIENVYPYPNGKHDGFIGLFEADTGCPTGNGLGDLCIKSYFLQVHTRGTQAAMVEQFHSFALAVQVEGGGYIFTGGLTDYGNYHVSYKQELCGIDNPTREQLNKPPYRANFSGGRPFQFWNSKGAPNRIGHFSWSSLDPFELPNPDDCTDTENVILTGLDHNEFQVFEMILPHLPNERPFHGFTDPLGNVDPSCTEISNVCIPLEIDANVPVGTPFFDRRVRQGDPGVAPILVYGR